MPNDLRINADVFSHTKIKKLKRRLGAEGVIALLCLWSWVAKHKPDGDLSGLDEDDLMLAADWEGQENIVQILVDLRLVDEIDGGFAIHDWAEHQPWCYHSAQRSEAAKKAAKSRWDKRSGVESNDTDDAERNAELCDSHAERMHTALRTDAEGNAPIPIPIPIPIPNPYPIPNPIPSPNPVPKPKQRESKRARPHAEILDLRFSEFWLAHPGKGSKQKAKQMWDKIVESDDMAKDVIEAVEQQVIQREAARRAGAWVPEWRHASTWLNQVGWLDDPIQFKPPERKMHHGDVVRASLASWLAEGEQN
jgi:hypothetical protein